MVFLQIVAAIVVAYLIIEYIQRRRARQAGLQASYLRGAEAGRSIANSVEAYLISRFRQFEEAFIPIYRQRLAALSRETEDIEDRRLAAQREFQSFAKELAAGAGRLVEEVQREFKAPFDAAQSLGNRDELVQLASDLVSRRSTEVLEHAMALAADAVAGTEGENGRSVVV